MTTQTEALKLALEALKHGGCPPDCKDGMTDSGGVHPWGEAALIPCPNCQTITAIKEALAQPEQEQIAVWLEKECDEQYLADRVRAGDYAKEKGHTENCAALADGIGKRHLSPSLVGIGVKDYTPQPELCKYGQEPKSCTSSPMDCQCAIDATFEQPEQEPVAWTDGPHLVMRTDWRDRANYKGPWVDIGRAIPNSWVPALYTTPPQRTWVGLTADEMNMIGDRMRTWNSHSLADVYVAIEAKLKEKNK